LLMTPVKDALKQWADGPVGIILSQTERKTWSRLRTDEERENFIRRFWAIRDANPDTPVNEYQQNFEKRVADADRLFSGSISNDGWQTERGRYYILLGPPASRAQFKGYGQIRPIELWFYSGTKDYPQLPPFFHLLFFQRDEIGDYTKYSPFIDQPQSLVKSTIRNTGDAYRILYNLNPELAHASLSLIPSEPVDTATFAPSMASDAILAQINQIPKREFERIGLLQELVDVKLKYQADAAEMDLYPLLTGPETFTVDFDVHRPTGIEQARMQTILWRGEQEIGRTVASFDGTTPLTGRLILKSGSYHVQATISDPDGKRTYTARQYFDLELPKEPLSMSDVLVFRSATPITTGRPGPFSYAGYQFTARPEKRLHPSEKLEVLFQLVRRERASENSESRKVQIDYTIANINSGAQRWTYHDEVAMSQFDSNGSLLNSKTLSIRELHPGRYFLIVTATDPAGHRASQTISFEVSGFETETSSRQ